MGDVLKWLLLVGLAVSLPAILSLTNDNRVDRFLGELSYPIYVVHVLVISAMSMVMQKSAFLTLAAVMVTIAVSVVAVLAVERPIDRWRQRRVTTLRQG
ncbi:hypothetical protein [Ferrovibrio sp.]|uniref:hypothetical protein n=1 Tax=Ferrovibrio sp. TaxID=1917215 RepID=UPI003D2D8527